MVGKGLTTLPRAASVTGGLGVLCAADLLAYADLYAPEAQSRRGSKRPSWSRNLLRKQAKVKAKHRKEHIRQAVARGVPREKAEVEYDRTIGGEHKVVGDWIMVELPPEHILYRKSGSTFETFTIADIQADPRAFSQTECCDPQEGPDYPSKSCAIIYAQAPRIRIYSRAHGDAFAYFAPLEWQDWSKTELGEMLRQMRDERGDDCGMFGKPGADIPVVKFGPLSAMADAAAEVLLMAKVPFYQRGNKLVRPVVLPVQSFGGELTSAAQLVEVELPYLRDMLCSCRTSHWMKYDKRFEEMGADASTHGSRAGAADAVW